MCAAQVEVFEVEGGSFVGKTKKPLHLTGRLQRNEKSALSSLRVETFRRIAEGATTCDFAERRKKEGNFCAEGQRHENVVESRLKKIGVHFDEKGGGWLGPWIQAERKISKPGRGDSTTSEKGHAIP